MAECTVRIAIRRPCLSRGTLAKAATVSAEKRARSASLSASMALTSATANVCPARYCAIKVGPKSSSFQRPIRLDMPGTQYSRCTHALSLSALTSTYAARLADRCSPRTRAASDWTPNGSPSGRSASESSTRKASLRAVCRAPSSRTGNPRLRSASRSETRVVLMPCSPPRVVDGSAPRAIWPRASPLGQHAPNGCEIARAASIAGRVRARRIGRHLGRHGRRSRARSGLGAALLGLRRRPFPSPASRLCGGASRCLAS